MTTPFDMIGTKRLAPTCTAIAEAGGTSEHAEWICKPGKAAALVAFMNAQMGGVNTHSCPVNFPLTSFLIDG